MPPNNGDKISFTVEFKSGDLKGLKAVDDFTQSLEEARQEIKDARKEGGIGVVAQGSEELDVASRKLNAIAGEANLVRRELVSARADVVRFAEEGGEEFEKAQAKAARLEAAFDSLKESARALPGALQDATTTTGGRGSSNGIGGVETDLSQNLGSIAQGAGALGLPQVQNALNLGSGASGALDILKALPETLDAVGKAALDNEGLLGGFAQAGADVAAKVVPAMSTSLAGFLTIAAPIAVVVGLATAALAILVDGMNKAAAAATDAAHANTEEAQRQVELNHLIEQGDTDSLQKQVQDAQDAFDAASAAFADSAQAADDAASRQSSAARNLLVGGGEGGLDTVLNAGAEVSSYNHEMETNLSTMQDAQAQLDQYTAALAAAEDQARRNAEIQGQVDALDRQMQVQREVNQLIESGSREQLDARRRQISQEIDLINSTLPGYQALADTSEAAASRVSELQGQLSYYNDLNTALNASEDDITAARVDETAAIHDQLSALQNRMTLEQNIISMTRDATVEQVQTRQQAIADEIEAIQSVLPEMESLAATSDEAAKQLADTNTHLANLREESSRLSSEVEPAARRRQVEEGERAVQSATKDSEERLLDIRKRAADQAEELEQTRLKSIGKAITDAQKSFDDLTKKTKKATEDENSKYFDSEKDALEKFRKQEEQADAQNKKERLRALDDLHESLLSAEEDNDVASFIRAKREGEKKLNQLTEDTDDATKARQDQFFEEGKAADKAHEDRMKQIEEARKEESDSISQHRDEAIQAANDTAKEQKQRLEQQTSQQIAREREALSRTLQNIQQKYNIETQAGKAAADSIKNGFLQAAQAVGQALASARANAVNNPGSSSSKPGLSKSDISKIGYDGKMPSSTGGFGTSGNVSSFSGGSTSTGGFNRGSVSVHGFAEGAEILPGKRRVEQMGFEGKYPEGIIPLEPTRLRNYFQDALGNMGGGGDHFEYSGDINVNGDGVTKQEIAEAINKGFYRFAAGVQRRRAGNG